MIREVLPKQPDFDRRFAGWAAKFITKNRWRYESIYEFNDLMNDAYLIFRHVKASYPLITEPSHLMALFKTAMVNDLIDKAKYKSRKYAAEISYEEVYHNNYDQDMKIIDTLGENNNEGLLRVILSELPPEVRMALDAFNDEEKLAILRKKKKQPRLAIIAGFPKKRETINDTLCKIIGLHKSIDLVGLLYEALVKN